MSWWRRRARRCPEERRAVEQAGEQAAAAKADAQQHLAAAREQGPAVREVADRLRQLRERDEFAQMIYEAMKRRGA